MPQPNKILPALLIFILLGYNLYATHIIGGEISYVCLGNNQYQITVKIYRDCYNGIPPLDNPAFFTVFDGNGNEISNTSVDLSADSIIPPKISNPCLVVPPNVCVEEGTYIFTETLPPTPGGYTISYQRCCRNGSILNVVDPGNSGSTYEATLNEAALNVCDNSPVFGNYPPILICANFPLKVDHSAYDADGDSLVYHLCDPLDGASTIDPQPTVASSPPYNTVNFVPPYTSQNPMGGNPPLSINAKTGLLTITPTAIGQYLVGICVDEYRKGVFLGTHHRDFQFNVVDCHPTIVASIPGFIRNCKTDSITFQNFSQGGNQFHWDFGVPGITSDTSNLEYPTFIFPDTGIYHVTLSVNAATACGDTATSTVAVYPALIPLTVTSNGCIGVPLQFRDSSICTAGNIISWDWTFGDNNSSGKQNPSHTYLTANNFSVSMVVSTNKGCVDSITKTIVIHPTPTVTVEPKDSIICSIDSIQLTGTVQGGGSVYQWNPNYNISDITIQSPLVWPSVKTTYHLIATNTFGCVGADSVSIVPYDTVFANAGKDTLICIGDTIQLHGSVFAAHYNWVPSSSLSTYTALGPKANPISTATYILKASAGTCHAADSVTVKVLLRPVLTVSANHDICFGDSSSISAAGLTSYSWIPPNTVRFPFQSNSPVFPTENTTYYVSGMDSTKCPITARDSQIVFVHHPELSDIKNDTTIVYGTSAPLWALWGISFTWSPDVAISNIYSQAPVVNPTVTTTYYVTSIDEYGCRGADSTVVYVTNDPIVLVPNAFSPNEDGINDYFKPIIIGEIKDYDLRIYNRWGELIFETSDPEKGWDGTYHDKKQDIDVFVFVLHANSARSSKSFYKKGNVSLLR